MQGMHSSIGPQSAPLPAVPHLSCFTLMLLSLAPGDLCVYVPRTQEPGGLGSQDVKLHAFASVFAEVPFRPEIVNTGTIAVRRGREDATNTQHHPATCGCRRPSWGPNAGPGVGCVGPCGHGRCHLCPSLCLWLLPVLGVNSLGMSPLLHLLCCGMSCEALRHRLPVDFIPRDPGTAGLDQRPLQTKACPLWWVGSRCLRGVSSGHWLSSLGSCSFLRPGHWILGW